MQDLRHTMAYHRAKIASSHFSTQSIRYRISLGKLTISELLKIVGSFHRFVTNVIMIQHHIQFVGTAG